MPKAKEDQLTPDLDNDLPFLEVAVTPTHRTPLEEALDTFHETALSPLPRKKEAQETIDFLQKTIESILPLSQETARQESSSSDETRLGSLRLELHLKDQDEMNIWLKQLIMRLEQANNASPDEQKTPEELKQQKETDKNIDQIAHRLVEEAAKKLNLKLNEQQLNYAVKAFKMNYKLYQSNQSSKKLPFDPLEVATIAKLSALSAAKQFKKACDTLLQPQRLFDKKNPLTLRIAPSKPTTKKREVVSKETENTLANQQDEANLALYGATANGKRRELGDLRLAIVVGDLFAAPDYNPGNTQSGTGLDLVSTPQFSQADPLGRREAEVILTLQHSSLQPDLERAYEKMTGLEEKKQEENALVSKAVIQEQLEGQKAEEKQPKKHPSPFDIPFLRKS